jgi:hypothetical protein
MNNVLYKADLSCQHSFWGLLIVNTYSVSELETFYMLKFAVAIASILYLELNAEFVITVWEQLTRINIDDEEIEESVSLKWGTDVHSSPNLHEMFAFMAIAKGDFIKKKGFNLV